MIQQNVNLRAFNTFGLGATAEYYTLVKEEDDLRAAIEWAGEKSLFVLGGGSNILFIGDVQGLTLHIATRGICYSEDKDYHYVEVSAGEPWHYVVMHTLERGIGGLENLSLIPGQIGAAPVQNIGAYGVELKDVFHSLTALHLPTLETHQFNLSACRFGYRSSIFKTTAKGEYIILSVKLALAKSHTLLRAYGDIEKTLEQMAVVEPTAKDISRAVIQIRQSKLPDPAVIGNAGSFFKNPVISPLQYALLKSQYDNIPSYVQPNGNVKIPAGWLIEQAGWKGKQVGHCGVHAKQALVLVNYGQASGKELLKLAESIQHDIAACFGVTLEMEVNVVG
ncbi:MAG: UDP-N-acetylmuramate dehydrogenase [Flavobacteriales bacterium]|nr:UDP-N-acetylmuramate dehydrogenase [Flavobacteriales bacterium]